MNPLLGSVRKGAAGQAGKTLLTAPDDPARPRPGSAAVCTPDHQKLGGDTEAHHDLAMLDVPGVPDDKVT
jgi:hypothetical protein